MKHQARDQESGQPRLERHQHQGQQSQMPGPDSPARKAKGTDAFRGSALQEENYDETLRRRLKFNARVAKLNRMVQRSGDKWIALPKWSASTEPLTATV